MASTGTPAQFVHPGEAIHGDLGMITDKDIALIISNSGETMELIHILPALKDKNIKVIGLIGRKGSLSRYNLTIFLIHLWRKKLVRWTLRQLLAPLLHLQWGCYSNLSFRIEGFDKVILPNYTLEAYLETSSFDS